MQARITLTDGSGRWFNPESARVWEQGTEFDGSNHVSAQPGCGRFEHERLYRTVSGFWVVEHWSQLEGSRSTYRAVTDEKAAIWLQYANEDAPEDVPAAYQAQAALEL